MWLGWVGLFLCGGRWVGLGWTVFAQIDRGRQRQTKVDRDWQRLVRRGRQWLAVDRD